MLKKDNVPTSIQKETTSDIGTRSPISGLSVLEKVVSRCTFIRGAAGVQLFSRKKGYVLVFLITESVDRHPMQKVLFVVGINGVFHPADNSPS